MKEAVIMTKEEYKSFYDSFQHLKVELSDANTEIDILKSILEKANQKIHMLKDALNRPAIEALQGKHDREYYLWCEETAKRYEEKDFEEWCVSRAKFYNNGVYNFCKAENISESDAYADRQYYAVPKFWSDSAIASGLARRCIDLDTDQCKKEGWSEIAWRRPFEWSYVLPSARWEIFSEHFNTKKGWDNEKYRRLHEQFGKIKELVGWDEYRR